MAAGRTEEQEILARTARELLRGYPPGRLRALRDGHDPDGFSRTLWAEMARLGWLGIVVPEAYGGAGLGWRDLQVVLEELGRVLAPEPVLSAVVGASALLLGGEEAQRRAHLPAVAAGERLVALAYQEPGSRFDPACVATRAERSGEGWRLSGEKTHVLDGHVADWLVVSARADEGITLFLVPRGPPGGGPRRGGCGGCAAGARARSRDHRARGHDARRDDGGLRDDARLLEDAHAVRRADRHVPGAQASGGADVRRDGARALGG